MEDPRHRAAGQLDCRKDHPHRRCRACHHPTYWSGLFEGPYWIKIPISDFVRAAILLSKIRRRSGTYSEAPRFLHRLQQMRPLRKLRIDSQFFSPYAWSVHILFSSHPVRLVGYLKVRPRKKRVNLIGQHSRRWYTGTLASKTLTKPIWLQLKDEVELVSSFTPNLYDKSRSLFYIWYPDFVSYVPWPVLITIISMIISIFTAKHQLAWQDSYAA